MSYNFESGLSKALEQLLKIESYYDVIIHVGREPNFKEFHAHSNILCCRSEYFNKILSTENIEKKDGKYIIKEPNISSQVFEIILKYLYTDQMNIANKTGTELLDLMIISDKLMLKKLVKLIEEYIIEHQQRFLQNDPVRILRIISYCKALVNLQELCLNKICSEPGILFNSDKFIQLSAPLLEIILQRDDLNLNEIEIWENLIKWGLAQEQVLNQDVSKWNKDDFNIFKRILYKFIPLIRFYEIPSEDYFNKVKPYEKVLSKELRNDITKFYMVPGYKPIYTPRNSNRLKCNIDSIIINQEHIAHFVNWIDRKKKEYINDVPYEFKLLYRASRDEQIIGGYNPLFWDSSNSEKSTIDSFIFSIADKNNFQSAKVVYSNGSLYSIRNYSHCGPYFGWNNLFVNLRDNPDFWYYYHCNSVNVSYIGALNLPNQIDVGDFEVFQVIKK
ncbi:BTB/POZ domain-containing protein [Rhizophagus irregularis DAOM 181602=DAOM 197198]|nr:BTB/POZ domain-containing protein [Rhizophagus irregularis DAOM 181602=DAOM 197198]